MTIRLTSVETFDKVLDKLKTQPLYNEEANSSFFRYSVDDNRKGIAKGDDEWYLDVDWLPDSRVDKVVMVIRKYKRSEIMTDVEYLNEESNDRETT